MFFTQEDYRKIEKWLLANSRKDTEFAGAATPLKGNETVVLVQNGKNVKTSVKDIVDQFFLLGVSDFLNITDKYGEKNITINQAIQLIPFRSRKIGQVITFIDEYGNWAIYQFQGKALNQWNNTTLWINILGSIVVSDVVPDEEDITGVKDGDKLILKFANKKYDPEQWSGLGRTYLRKNVTTVIDSNTGQRRVTNLLSQDMMPTEDTIYILQYDYDLNGQTIIVPDNSVILFEGGSISNGIINGVNTLICAGKVKIFENIKITGTFKNRESKVSWFGGLLNQSIIDSLAFISPNVNLDGMTFTVKRLDLTTVNTLQSGTLIADNENTNQTVNILHIHDNSNDILIKDVVFLGGANQRPTTPYPYENMIRIEKCGNVILQGCEITGYAQSQGVEQNIEWGLKYASAININNCKDVTIDSCRFHDNHHEQSIFYDPSLSYSLKVLNCKTYSNKDAYGTFINYGFKDTLYQNNTCTQGVASFIATQGNNCIITGNFFEDTSYFAVSTEWTGGSYMNDNQIVTNNVAKNCRYGAFNVGVSNTIVSGNLIDSCGGRYGSIYCKGKTYGLHPYYIESKEALPYDNSVFEDSYNITIANNIIKNDLGTNAIAIKSQSDYANKADVISSFGVIHNVNIIGNTIESTVRPLYFVDTIIQGLQIKDNKVITKNNILYPVYARVESQTTDTSHLDDVEFVGNTFENMKGNYTSYLMRFEIPYVNGFLFNENIIKNLTTASSLIMDNNPNSFRNIKGVDNNVYPYCAPIMFPESFIYPGNVKPKERKTIRMNEYNQLSWAINCAIGDSILFNSDDSNQYCHVLTNGTTGYLQATAATTAGSPIVTVTGYNTALAVGNLVNIDDDVQQALILEVSIDNSVITAKLNKNALTTGSKRMRYCEPVIVNSEGTLISKVVIV